MAQYDVPPDPRESQFRPRRQRKYKRDWVPFVGLLLGLVVTIVAAALAWRMVTAFLATEPLPNEPQLEIVRLTAPASPTPTPTEPLETPTPVPTLTPEPPPDVSSAPDVVQIGFYAQVANTDNVGVTVRGGPSTDNVRLLVANEGTVMLVLDGPTEGSGFTWWQVQLDDGTEGWIAAEFLAPADAPAADG